jgi:hypothetical protein
MHSGISVALASVMFGSLSEIGHADEVGISYWLPGRRRALQPEVQAEVERRIAAGEIVSDGTA